MYPELYMTVVCTYSSLYYANYDDFECHSVKGDCYNEVSLYHSDLAVHVPRR